LVSVTGIFSDAQEASTAVAASTEPSLSAAAARDPNETEDETANDETKEWVAANAARTALKAIIGNPVQVINDKDGENRPQN
jgi:hypothetical protein